MADIEVLTCVATKMPLFTEAQVVCTYLTCI